MRISFKRLRITSAIPVFFTFSLFLLGCTPAIVPANKEIANESGQTPSLLAKIQREGVIKVGTTGDYIPFSYQLDHDSSVYNGVDIELAKDLAKSLGVQLQFVKTSWPTLMADLRSKRFDIGMSGIAINLTRQKEALFSIPILSSGKAAIARDENVAVYNTIDAINRAGVRVIVNPGGTNELFTKKNFPKATIIVNQDNLDIFQRIVNEEADVMVTDAIETLAQQIIHPELEAINPEEPFNFFEKGYLLPVDHTLKAYVDQWLHLRLKDGTYQKIFDIELNRIKQEFAKE